MSALNTQIGGSHYKDCAIQPIQYIEANKLQFLEGCVVKRVTRHDKPTGKGLQDIDKAIHELELIREVRYGKQTQPAPATPARAEELQADDGWIEWGGGECPVSPDAKVDVRVNSGALILGELARYLPWGMVIGSRRTVAYRLTKEQA